MGELDTLQGFDEHVAAGRSLRRVVLQDLDLRDRSDVLATADLDGAVLLGCRLEPAALNRAVAAGAIAFPSLPGLLFNPYRAELYTAAELADGYDPAAADPYATTFDARVEEWAHSRPRGDVVALLAQRLHDHSVTLALLDAIDGDLSVGVMGGHDLARDDPAYAGIVALAGDLAEAGFVVATGGGPGAMEAANLGPWLAGQPDTVTSACLGALAAQPGFADRAAWLEAALAAHRPLEDASIAPPRSIGIPTWYYRREPPNLFAAGAAKYFANSLREDGLLNIANGGIVFTPGSAGTYQEIFQDAALNHYGYPDDPRPMIFLGSRAWSRYAVADLVRANAGGRAYGEEVVVTDDPTEVVEVLVAHRAAAARFGGLADPL